MMILSSCAGTNSLAYTSHTKIVTHVHKQNEVYCFLLIGQTDEHRAALLSDKLNSHGPRRMACHRRLHGRAKFGVSLT